MKEHDMHHLFKRSEELSEVSDNFVNRSIYWWQQKLSEEAEETKYEDPELDHHKFLLEGADVMIAWIGAMRSAGVSWETALEAVLFKYDVVEERLNHTADLMGNGKTWDENYNTIKGKSKPVDIYSSPFLDIGGDDI